MPLVDVMLVLLIIFMVAAPMLQRGVEVNLPVARQTQKMTEQRTVCHRAAELPQGSTRHDRRRYVPLDVLAERMRQSLVAKDQKEVFLRADGAVQTQELMDVIERAQGGRHRARRHRRAGTERAVVDAVSEVIAGRLQQRDAMQSTLSASLARAPRARCGGVSRAGSMVRQRRSPRAGRDDHQPGRSDRTARRRHDADGRASCAGGRRSRPRPSNRSGLPRRRRPR